jgi:transcriptional regulator with XRE-family HTH domain
MVEDPLSEVIGRALREAPFAMRQLAADSGLSYDVLRSWRSGRRRPSRASARRLAEGLERRSEQLRELARELRTRTEGDGAREPRTPDHAPAHPRAAADAAAGDRSAAWDSPQGEPRAGAHGDPY